MFAGGTFEGIVRCMNMERFLIFGLGNPGAQFIGTRHNVGADMVRAWERPQHAIVLEPKLYMNESGKTLAECMRYYNIPAERVLVVHDDLELALGEIKLQTGGSAKGHNGIRSIQEHFGNADIARLRIGIGRPADETPVEKFVLSKFTAEEKAVLKNKEKEILQAISDFAFPAITAHEPHPASPS